MIDYSAHMIARSEHEYRQQSLAPVSDFDAQEQKKGRPWAFGQVGQVLQSVGSAVASLGRRLDSQQERNVDAGIASVQLSEQVR